MHHSRGDLYRRGTSFVIFWGEVSTTIGGIIDAGDEFHIYHGILLGQIKTFGIKKIPRFCPNTPSEGCPTKYLFSFKYFG